MSGARALSQSTSAAEIFARAVALHQAGRPAEARVLYERVVQMAPAHADALHLLGLVAFQSEDAARAVELTDRAIAISASNPAYFNTRGLARATLGHLDAALADFDVVLRRAPGMREARFNRGCVLLDARRPLEALRDFDEVLAKDAAIFDVHLKRGLALLALDRAREACAAFACASAIRKDSAEASCFRGIAHYAQGAPREAIAQFDRALGLRPGYPEALWNKSLALLSLGDYARGWPLYESRWSCGEFKPFRHAFDMPQWTGREALEGRTILVHNDQGLGDAIQLARYVPMLAERGARVQLDIDPPLRALVGRLDGVDSVLEPGTPRPASDWHVPLSSMPLAFGTEVETVPAPSGYLRADPLKIDAMRARLGERTVPRIGLVWSGSAAHANDRNRGVPLRLLTEYLPAGLQYHCLQKETRASDRAAFEAASCIADHAAVLGDFDDTAALCTLMDLVVSVDTSVAHLAGALGQPVRILVPFAPDWRWMFGREDSPWYASARLVRQDAPGDWRPVLERLRRELETLRTGAAPSAIPRRGERAPPS